MQLVPIEESIDFRDVPGGRIVAQMMPEHLFIVETPALRRNILADSRRDRANNGAN